jgi:bacterioferritin-associated ferredoxin
VVTHCLCENLTIADVVAWARARGTKDMDTIGGALGCSTHCGMCRPFIEYSLATGVTVVPYPCPDIPAGARALPKP